MQSPQTTLTRWCIWFFLANALFFLLIGLNYLPTISWLDSEYLNHHSKTVLKIFALFAYLGQFGLLALLPILILIPIIYLLPKQKIIFPLVILLASLMSVLLILDMMTYKLYHFHLNRAVIDFILRGTGDEVLGLSKLEYGISFAIVLGTLILETALAIFLWRYLIQPNRCQGYVKWFITFFGLSLYTSYLMLIYSSGLFLHRVLYDATHFLPFYTEIFQTLLPIKNNPGQMERAAESYLIQPKKVNAPLNYPLHTLQCTPAKQPLNIVVMVIDAWRFDMVNQAITPNITQFAHNAWTFSNHLSGGNATGPGIFSLFYGLPASYWTAMETQHRGPVLIDELLKQHYQMGIFGSAPLSLPPFHKTVFAAIHPLSLKTLGPNPYVRDKLITEKFKQFLAQAVTQPQPFFSFLFYDGAHSYCSYKKDLHPLVPAVKHCNRLELTNQADITPYFNRYKNALMLVDEQVNEVLTALKEKHILDNTVVVITGDHGEEFNDNHRDFVGHASNFTRYQTATPLIVYWPYETPHHYTHQTSHFDVAPTLLHKLLGCQTPFTDYSLGKSLLDTSARPYLIINSYIALGVVEPERITYLSPTGSVRIEQPDSQPNPNTQLNLPVMRHVFQDLRRFYRV